MVLSQEFGTSQDDVAKHFVAVSNIEKVTKFGINPDNVFPMWDCRRTFFFMSAVGLTISLAVGYDNFEELLEEQMKWIRILKRLISIKICQLYWHY
jgi:glucose-6-phosphate isomerase